MAPGVLEKQNVFWGIVCAKSKQLISKNKPILGEKENSSSITAVKPPFLTFSATVQGWDCSHFSQSIQHTHTHRHELKWRATCVAHAVPSPCSLWQKGLFQVGHSCMPASKRWVQRGHLVLLTSCQTAPNEGAQLLQCHGIVSTKPAARPTRWKEHTRSCTCSNNS